MYHKRKWLEWKENKGIRTFSAEDSKRHIVGNQVRLLKYMNREELYYKKCRPKNNMAKIKEMANKDEKECIILQREVGRAIKKLVRRKAIGEDDIKVYLLKD